MWRKGDRAIPHLNAALYWRDVPCLLTYPLLEYLERKFQQLFDQLANKIVEIRSCHNNGADVRSY